MNKKEKIILLLILLAALFLRVAHWWDVREDPFFAHLVMDSEAYDRWANEIAEGNWLGSEVFFQAPLYPYFIAAVYTLIGHSPDAVYLIQIVISLLGIYALYRTGKKLGGGKVGLVAAALSAFYGVYLFYDVQLLKESLAVAFVCFLFWTLVEARESKALALWILAGVICGFLSLLRENMLLIVPFLIFLSIRPREKVLVLFSAQFCFYVGNRRYSFSCGLPQLESGRQFFADNIPGRCEFLYR